MNPKRRLYLFLLLALTWLTAWQPDQAQAQVPPVPQVSPTTRRIRPTTRTKTPAPPSPGATPATAAATGATTKSSTSGLGTTGNSSGAASADAKYEYNFPSMPIDQILDEYSKLVGRTLLKASQGASAVASSTMITLKTESPLTRSEAIMALETVLGMNGITFVPIGEKFAKVVVDSAAGTAGGLISTNSAKSIPDAGKYITQIVPLRYAAAAELQQALQPFAKTPASIIIIPSTQTLILRDYAENVKRMMEMVEKIDVLTPLIIKPEVIPIKFALAADIASALSALGASGGTSVGKSTSGASFSGNRPIGNGSTGVGGGSMGGMGGSMGGGVAGGSPGSYPGQATQNPQTSAAGGSRSNFGQNLQRIVANAANGGTGQFTLFGQTKIIADERTNSLLVFANDEDMAMIKTIISKLDVVLAQVLIEAIILEINLTQTKSTGVSYLVNKQSGGTFTGAGGANNLSSGASSFLTSGSASGSSGTNGGTALPGSTLASLPGGFSYFSKFGNDLNVVAEAVAGDSRVNVLSRPRIQTSHAVPADLFIGNTVPYVTGTYNYGYGSGPSSQYTQLEVGTHLQVLPLINPDGLVVMDIQADIEQLGPDVQISGVGGVPTTTKRQAGAKVAVHSGDTVILGGFINASRSKSNSGIPLLKDIPILGALFRSDSVENDRTELIVLMRPTVLKTPEIAAAVAVSEKNKMSEVKAAELDLREDERKRNEAVEAQLAKEAARKKAAEEKKAKKEKKQLEKGEPIDEGTNSVPESENEDL